MTARPSALRRDVAFEATCGERATQRTRRTLGTTSNCSAHVASDVSCIQQQLRQSLVRSGSPSANFSRGALGLQKKRRVRAFEVYTLTSRQDHER